MKNDGLSEGESPDARDRAVPPSGSKFTIAQRTSRIVTVTAIELHHLHGGPVAAPDLRGESLSEQGHLFPLRRTNVCRQRFAIPVFTPLRSEEDEVGKLARGQPREPAALVKPTKREASIAVEAVPRSTLSQHFNVLREAGLIHSERRGVEMQDSSRCTEIERRFRGLIPAILAAHAAQQKTASRLARAGRRKPATRSA